MNAARLAPLLVSAFCLSACAGGPANDAMGRQPAARSTAAGDSPLAVLPPLAGRVVALRTTSRSNGLSQEIVLDGPRGMTGENRIMIEAVTTAGGGGPTARGDALRLRPASDTEVEAEMEARFPGVQMRISTAMERDALGPFGYASGSAGRLACVYAWQYVAPSRPLTLFEGASDTGALPMSVRVRLCREAPAAALLDDLRHLVVVRPGGPPPDPGAGGRSTGGDALEAATGRPMSMAAVDAPSVASAPPARAARPSAARRPAHARAWSRTWSHRLPRASAWKRAPALPGLPRLPMPDEVAQAGAAPARGGPGAPMPARSARLDPDAMPLPR